jgi:hypothetical protein
MSCLYQGREETGSVIWESACISWRFVEGGLEGGVGLVWLAFCSSEGLPELDESILCNLLLHLALTDLGIYNNFEVSMYGIP